MLHPRPISIPTLMSGFMTNMIPLERTYVVSILLKHFVIQHYLEEPFYTFTHIIHLNGLVFFSQSQLQSLWNLLSSPSTWMDFGRLQTSLRPLRVCAPSVKNLCVRASRTTPMDTRSFSGSSTLACATGSCYLSVLSWPVPSWCVPSCYSTPGQQALL